MLICQYYEGNDFTSQKVTCFFTDEKPNKFSLTNLDNKITRNGNRLSW